MKLLSFAFVFLISSVSFLKSTSWVMIYSSLQERYFPAKVDPDPIGWDKHFFQSGVRRAFEQEDFATLEKWIAEVHRENPRYKDGTFKITVFYAGIAEGKRKNEQAYLEELSRHQNWERAYPDSVARLVALAEFWKDYAWLARGSGWADTVTEEGWRLFRERIHRSAETLVLAAKRPQKDLHWGDVAMTVGMAQSWKPELFDKVIKMYEPLDPDFYPLHSGRVYSLLPRWLGEIGDWEAYAAEVSEKAGNDELYARMVFSVYTMYGNVFTQSDASWEKTKSGLDSLLVKYPEATLLKNRAARLAVLAKDYEYANARFDEIGRLYHERIWNDVDQFHKYLRVARLNH